MNCNCFIFLLVSIGAVVSAPVIDYEKVAKEIITNFPIGPGVVPDAWYAVLYFVFQGQEYELSIKDPVIRRFQSARLQPVGVINGHPLPTPGQHSMEIRLILGTVTMDSKLMYKKKGSSESPKQLNLVSTIPPDQESRTKSRTVINFDVNERKVLSCDKVETVTMTAYDMTSNCNEQTLGFCKALHKYLKNHLSYSKVAYQLSKEVKKQLTGRQY